MAEQRFSLGHGGPLLRPFCQRAQILPRGCSGLLQRVLSDFAAEQSFQRASASLREHYGIELAASTLRRRSLHHAAAMRAFEPKNKAPTPARQLLVEMDGSLLPIVSPTLCDGKPPGDRRRHKKLEWKEVRLCAARPDGRAQAIYGAVMGSVLEAGLVWEGVAQRAGLAQSSCVHGVGDGAEWIAEQFALRFGNQGRYLVDFYHVSEYVTAAAAGCAPRVDGAAERWRQQQQQRLQTNQLKAVLRELNAHLENETAIHAPRRHGEPSSTPVRDCHRYLSKRREHLEYARALAEGLPIGSGLIESGHRHVLQARLKQAGTWWNENNARAMVAMRVLRANGDWESYWSTPSYSNN